MLVKKFTSIFILNLFLCKLNLYICNQQTKIIEL